jgi:tocopherol O-methyltransferase
MSQLNKKVAEHYDDLDPLYRKIWGEHVHHGYWKKETRSHQEAVRNLVSQMAERSQMKAGQSVCDVGCGYGATSRMLAEIYGVSVTGFTLSQAQHRYGRKKNSIKNVTLHHCDWFLNQLPAESTDHVIAIESTEHMESLSSFLREARRVLRPGGRVSIYAWLSSENPTPLEKKWLLDPIIQEGRLKELRSASDCLEMLQKTQFENIQFQDQSQEVKKTWNEIILRTIQYFFNNPRDLKFLSHRHNSNAEFAKTLFRILIAYEQKCMRYGWMMAEKASTPYRA